MIKAYYNENNPAIAAWLKELIGFGVITQGEVDERSIEDVTPNDLKGFNRCHFFAGIGCWDYALNLAGWPDDRQVWTGSCPCQPFSAAGKGGGFTDERHLWPAWFHLINICRPDTVFGEQVASRDGLAWLNLVSSDLEGALYRCAPFDIPAACVGAPHKRQRLFFVADSASDGHSKRYAGSVGADARSEQRRMLEPSGDCPITALGDNAISIGRRRQGDGDTTRNEREIQIERLGASGKLGNAENSEHAANTAARRSQLESRRNGAVGGFWHDAEWLYCADGKYRPSKPGIFPLVNGASRGLGCGSDISLSETLIDRTTRLEGYGNAIVVPVAQAFIKAYLMTL
jgi:DNA (cytosine-5)-methyltransferase 1